MSKRSCSDSFLSYFLADRALPTPPSSAKFTMSGVGVHACFQHAEDVVIAQRAHRTGVWYQCGRFACSAWLSDVYATLCSITIYHSSSNIRPLLHPQAPSVNCTRAIPQDACQFNMASPGVSYTFVIPLALRSRRGLVSLGCQLNFMRAMLNT